ncbi:FtsK/SpoIIIE domain-containing protein [Streptococcus macacae]|uniref:FtsK/SpoIIIE family protein n=1 Tax=Streptococcus macacae NCTC 11558 TaxID=764298 RepID=G5JXV6_9STRE|nr:FtsK/SpoIIIE domain-containing protein [Streptococcus macacae]EHJ52120.1 FtsK/SpoIIIE family protein [Streptococcus macacae NCTC 11558]SUN77878.1 reticulocyte binding protein [Streptococcus macacae NCTC 11558]
MPQPWLPPLSTEIFVQDLRQDCFQDLWQGESRLEAIIGMVDIPSEQRQTVGTYALADDGNLAIFGGPSMGKSSLLQTIVMDLSRQQTPEQIHFYIFDFGTSALYPLKNLPHTADFITSDQEEKLTKFMDLMKREIQSRKRLFNRHHVNSKAMYQAVTDEALPQIMIVVDNYEGYKDIQTEQLRNGFDTLTQTLARDGNSLGITVIVSGGRLAAIRPVLLANFKTRLSLKLTDESEIKTIMGHYTMSTESIAGRGLITIEEVEVFQAALSNRGATPVQRLQALRQEISQMDQFWQGDRPAEIPIVPEEISLAQFMDRADTKNAMAKPALPLGLDMTTVETIALDFSAFRHLIVFSDNSEQIRLMVDRLIATVSQSNWSLTTLLLDVNEDYPNYESKVSHYVSDPTLLSDMTDFMVSEIKNRETDGWDQYCIAFIPDLESYEKVSGLSQTELAALMTRGPRVGFFIIVGTAYSYLVSIHPVPKYLKENGQYHFIGMKLSDQNFLDKAYNAKERHPAMDEAYIHNRKTYYKLKLSHNSTEATF